MFDTTSQFESAANLFAAGAVASVADPENPRQPVMYIAGHQDVSQGVVHLDMAADSRLRLAAKREAQTRSPKADKKYAALESLAPSAKPGQGAAALQMDGMQKYAALQQQRLQPANRAALRAVKAPEAKAAPKPIVAAPPTLSMSVGALNARQDDRSQQSLDRRMRELGAYLGDAPTLRAYA